MIDKRKVQQLVERASGGDERLAPLMRDVWVLASRAGVEELTKWARLELDGYKGAGRKLPPYRVHESRSVGTFSDDVGRRVIDYQVEIDAGLKETNPEVYDMVVELTSTTALGQSIDELEALLDRIEAADGTPVRRPWPPELRRFAVCNLVGFRCMVAETLLTEFEVRATLNRIRNGLLEFLLDLEQRLTGLSEEVSAEQGKAAEQQLLRQVFLNCSFHGDVIGHNSMTVNSSLEAQVVAATMSGNVVITEGNGLLEEALAEVRTFQRALLDAQGELGAKFAPVMAALQELQQRLAEQGDVSRLEPMLEDLWLRHVKEDMKTTGQKLLASEAAPALRRLPNLAASLFGA